MEEMNIEKAKHHQRSEAMLAIFVFAKETNSNAM